MTTPRPHIAQSQRERAVLLMADGRWRTTQEVGEALGLSRCTAFSRLSELGCEKDHINAKQTIWRLGIGGEPKGATDAR